MQIKNFLIREIFDSRAESTIEVGLGHAKLRLFFAQVPSGKSRGRQEAVVFPFKKIRSVFKNFVLRQLKGKSFERIQDFDRHLARLDPTPRKSKISGNLSIGLSVAFAKALAFQKKLAVWEMLRREFFPKNLRKTRPLIFSNLINGGQHTLNNLAIQEYLVIVKAQKTYAESFRQLRDFYEDLGEYLKKSRRLERLALGDEGGYVLDFSNNYEPLKILEKLIFKRRLRKEFSLGLDIAASSFFKNEKYAFEGKTLKGEQLMRIYLSYFLSLKSLISLEDPFAEKEPVEFYKLREMVPQKWIVGDDLTVTNPRLVEKYAQEKVINAVIIKPVQNGTVSGTCQAIQTARNQKLKTIVSHRSGETEDVFILHLAKACSADGVKIGAPCRERIYKFNELVRLYD